MRVCVLASCVVLCLSGWFGDSLFAQSSKKSKYGITFKGRVKFNQATKRVLKISVEPDVLPLDSETLTTLLNSPAVAGKAANDTFGLSIEEYEPYIRISATTSPKLGYIIARLDVTFRADGRVPSNAVRAYYDSLSNRLQDVLSRSIAVDRTNISKRQDALLERQQYLEKKYMQIWTDRVRVSEDSGLAERSVDGARSTVAGLDEKLVDVEVELELRKTRLSHVQDELDAQRSASAPPKRDPLAEELEKLVRIRARQVETAANAGSTEDEKDAAEARMLEAKIRWIERVEELAKLDPRERKKTLEMEIDELSTMQQTYTKQLSRSVEQARDLFRYTEHITLLQKKEERIDKALDRIEEQVDELANYSEKLGTVTVTIMGQLP